MPLLIPLLIFIALCFVMIVALAKTQPPNAAQTVEALCDAILRDDLDTQKDLVKSGSTSKMARRALGPLRARHSEVGASYGCEIEKIWDDATKSYALVSVPLDSPGESIHFTCECESNRWLVTSITLSSPKARID